MSAVERLEHRAGEKLASAGVEPSQTSSIEAPLMQSPLKRARLRPLLALAPYVGRYRGRAIVRSKRSNMRVYSSVHDVGRTKL